MSNFQMYNCPAQTMYNSGPVSTSAPTDNLKDLQTLYKPLPINVAINSNGSIITVSGAISIFPNVLLDFSKPITITIPISLYSTITTQIGLSLHIYSSTISSFAVSNRVIQNINANDYFNYTLVNTMGSNLNGTDTVTIYAKIVNLKTGGVDGLFYNSMLTGSITN